MQRNDFKIEVCANSVQSVISAAEAGADRAELCAGMPEGGTTPSIACIRKACRIPGIEVNVIIRPRSGDFLYDDLEKEVILEDIRAAKEAGAAGIVSGMLTEDGRIDAGFLCRCIREADPLPFTFHRAFDMCRDPFEALRTLEDCGCCRLLSSGCEPTALQGISLLRRLVDASRHVIVMPGCGIHAENIRQIAEQTTATEFHLSGRISIPSRMQFRNTKVSMGGSVRIDEYAHDRSSAEKIAGAIRALTE